MKLKPHLVSFLTRIAICVCFLLIFSKSSAQDSIPNFRKSNFWEKVRFGAGLGFNVGGGYTNIVVAPSAVYDVNDYYSVGLGLQYGFVKEKNVFDSHLYGGSIINLINPIPEVQLSVELEELRVNTTFVKPFGRVKDDFWNTALYLGAGYRTQNVTIGIRYNILYKESNFVYSEAWMPFVRVYF